MDPKLQHHMSQEQSVDREKEIGLWEERIAQGERPWDASRGLQSVLDAVRDRRFPTTAQDLSAQVGDREVWISGSSKIALRRVLGKLKGEDVFPSMAEFTTIVQRHWEGIRNLEVPADQWPPARRQLRPEG